MARIAGRVLVAALLAVIVALPAGAVSNVGCTIYVDDDGSNTSPYDTWAKASTGLDAAIESADGTDIVCVRNDHAETSSGANITLGPATVQDEDNPLPIYSADCTTCDGTDDSYTKATSAQYALTSANNLILDGFYRWFGVWLEAGNNISAWNIDEDNAFYDSTLKSTSTSGIGVFGFAQAGKSVVLYDTAIDFGADTGGRFNPGSDFQMYGGAVTGETVTSLFESTGGDAKIVQLFGVDLSAADTENNLISMQYCTYVCQHRWVGVALPDSYTLHDSSFQHNSNLIDLIHTDDSTGAGYVRERHRRHGVVKTSTSVYADFAFTEGSTDASLELNTDSTVNDDFGEALCTWWNETGWIDASGNTATDDTIEVEVVENHTSAMTADDLWMEILQPGTASSTLYSLENAGGDLTGSTALSAGTGLANWTGEPAGSRSVKLSVTFDINKSGTIMWRVCQDRDEAGKFSYVSPNPTVTVN